VAAVRWGLGHEQEAVDDYIRNLCPVSVSEVGLVLHPSGVLAASPDRLIGETALLEVKCPYEFKSRSIPEALADPKFYVSVDDTGKYCLRKDHVYYDQ